MADEGGVLFSADAATRVGAVVRDRENTARNPWQKRRRGPGGIPSAEYSVVVTGPVNTDGNYPATLMLQVVTDQGPPPVFGWLTGGVVLARPANVGVVLLQGPYYRVKPIGNVAGVPLMQEVSLATLPVIRVTSTTKNANGYYPAIVETWTDGSVPGLTDDSSSPLCWAEGPNNEYLALWRYNSLLLGVHVADGLNVYSADASPTVIGYNPGVGDPATPLPLPSWLLQVDLASGLNVTSDGLPKPSPIIGLQPATLTHNGGVTTGTQNWTGPKSTVGNFASWSDATPTFATHMFALNLPYVAEILGIGPVVGGQTRVGFAMDLTNQCVYPTDGNGGNSYSPVYAVQRSPNVLHKGVNGIGGGDDTIMDGIVTALGALGYSGTITGAALAAATAIVIHNGRIISIT
jgi:hypothetical protein